MALIKCPECGKEISDKGYTHNKVTYTVTSDSDYYYIIISVAK